MKIVILQNNWMTDESKRDLVNQVGWDKAGEQHGDIKAHNAYFGMGTQLREWNPQDINHYEPVAEVTLPDDYWKEEKEKQLEFAFHAMNFPTNNPRINVLGKFHSATAGDILYVDFSDQYGTTSSNFYYMTEMRGFTVIDVEITTPPTDGELLEELQEKYDQVVEECEKVEKQKDRLDKLYLNAEKQVTLQGAIITDLENQVLDLENQVRDLKQGADVCEDCKSDFEALAKKEVALSPSVTITAKTAKGMANQVKRYLVKTMELHDLDIIVRQERSNKWLVIWEGGAYEWAIYGSMGGSIFGSYEGSPTFAFTHQGRVLIEAENSYSMSFINEQF